MGRPISRSFFWIDQAIVRTGLWVSISTEAVMVYVALSASVDRNGISSLLCNLLEKFQRNLIF